MNQDLPFCELLARVRAGDEQATSDLVRIYEPQIRRVARVRLTSPSLRRQMDSMDICQSVMGDFFLRTAMGQFDLETPAQLIGLLAKMAQNKVIGHARRQRAARRDIRRLEFGGNGDLSLAGDDPTPSRVVAGRELLELVRTRLTARDRYLAEQRAFGRSWQELATELDEKPDALRMRLSRALDRVTADVGLSEMG
ncbi:MAG: RNA polymerase sigma factor [Thermoguttaceae bacterium]